MTEDTSWMIQHLMHTAPEAIAQRRERHVSAFVAAILANPRWNPKYVEQSVISHAIEIADALIESLDRK